MSNHMLPDSASIYDQMLYNICSTSCHSRSMLDNIIGPHWVVTCTTVVQLWHKCSTDADSTVDAVFDPWSCNTGARYRSSICIEHRPKCEGHDERAPGVARISTDPRSIRRTIRLSYDNRAERGSNVAQFWVPGMEGRGAGIEFWSSVYRMSYTCRVDNGTTFV